MALYQLVKGVCPAVFGIQNLGFFHLAVPEQVDGHAVIGVIAVAVRPNLTDGELAFLIGFHMENPVHLTHAVGVFVAKVSGNGQLHFQSGRFAGAEGAE